MQSNKEKKRKSRYNENRDSYLSIDGKYYCYNLWDEDSKSMKTEKIEIGEDLSVDWTIVLDDLDHANDLNDRYASEARDKVFDAKLAQFEANSYKNDAKNPWEDIGNSRNNPEEILFSEPKPKNEKTALVRKVVDENLTDNQKKLYYDHFGMNKQLVEIAREEGELTGKSPSSSAMNNRKNKLLKKISKIFGEK